MARPLGTITRGTTATNRLRRVDRWLVATYAGALRGATDPLVVDLGYGASAWTTVELAERLRGVRPDVDVWGVEIDPERVRAAQAYAGPGLTFAHGGFELGTLADRRPVVVRAFNVLRQYDEAQVPTAWQAMTSRLVAGGTLLDGTCDEQGRLATWLDSGPEGVRTLTLAARLASLERPSRWAERLPKVLIHHNVPGEPVHRLLTDLDRAWAAAAPYGSYGLRQRFTATVDALRGSWPIRTTAHRARLGEITLDWPPDG
jgi:hypothetical protein